jgi:hypothetical protein
MKPRNLRIAWSVASGFGAVLIAACLAVEYLGVNVELMRRGSPGPTVVEIYQGKLWLSWEPRVSYRPGWAGQINRYGLRYNVYSNGSWYVWVSTWVVGALLAVAAAPFAAWPWLSLRFSLRTLLIATTLIAVVLGLVVYLNRPPTVPPINVGDFGR